MKDTVRYMYTAFPQKSVAALQEPMIIMLFLASGSTVSCSSLISLNTLNNK